MVLVGPMMLLLIMLVGVVLGLVLLKSPRTMRQWSYEETLVRT
jgi:uncharacterized membrane protein affecting hemolysin expression